MSMALKFSDDVEMTTNYEDTSPYRGVTLAEKDGRNADSESTYSCLDVSHNRNSVDSKCDFKLTCQNVSSTVQNMPIKYSEDEGQSPGNSALGIECKVNDSRSEMFSENNEEIDVDGKDGPEASSSASSAYVQGINEEDGEYIIPRLGVEFESEDHAYKCYNRFALMEGFSIRKDFINRSKLTGLVVSRRYTCHRQGHRSTKYDMSLTKPRKETRTGCSAHMTITRQPNGKYHVIHFGTRHNHVLVTPVTAHLLPSQKRVSFVQAVEAESTREPVAFVVPKLGMGFDSEDHAYEFYNLYAGRIGFSVRKDYVNRSKIDGAVASRRYTCFREGYRQKDKRGSKVKRPRKETRVGCMAQLVISRQPDGRYRITHFEESHNHELVPACKIRSLRSQKKLPHAAECSINDVLGFQPSLSVTGVTNEFCYCDSLKHEMLTTKCVRSIKEEEIEALHLYFQRKKSKDPLFFYAVQLDAEEKLTNFFWADEKMSVDSREFGDVVYFDTTYYLNRDNQPPLIILFGINNHKQLVVFGAALLYADTLDSYKWLLRNFIQSTNGRKPKTVLSDQDATISEAFILELPEIHHWTSTWHVYQNALKHVSEVVAKSDSFSIDLRSCFFDPDVESFAGHIWSMGK